MIEEIARIVARENGHAWIETQRRSTCGACNARSGCGTSVLSQVLGNRAVRIKALNEIDAQVGDEVVVGLNDGALVRGSAAVYLVPLLTLFAGALVAQTVAPQWGMGDGFSVFGGLLGLGMGFGWLRLFGNRVSGDARYQAVILRRAETPTAVRHVTFR